MYEFFSQRRRKRKEKEEKMDGRGAGRVKWTRGMEGEIGGDGRRSLIARNSYKTFHIVSI